MKSAIARSVLVSSPSAAAILLSGMLSVASADPTANDGSPRITEGDFAKIWCYRDSNDLVHRDEYGVSPTTRRNLFSGDEYDPAGTALRTVYVSFWSLEHDEASNSYTVQRYGWGSFPVSFKLAFPKDGNGLIFITSDNYELAAVQCPRGGPIPIQQLQHAKRLQ